MLRGTQHGRPGTILSAGQIQLVQNGRMKKSEASGGTRDINGPKRKH